MAEQREGKLRELVNGEWEWNLPPTEMEDGYSGFQPTKKLAQEAMESKARAAARKPKNPGWETVSVDTAPEQPTRATETA